MGGKDRVESKAPVPEDCAIQSAIHLIARKWTLPILYFLNDSQRPVRFLELRRTVGPVTQKELTKRLRELEASGLVSRQVFAEIPPRVEYQLTPSARELFPHLWGVWGWAEKHLGNEKANRGSVKSNNFN